MAKFYDRNPNQKDDYISDEDEYYIHSENTNTSKTVLNEDYNNSNIGKTVSNEGSNNSNTNPYDWRSQIKSYDGLGKAIKVVMCLLFISIFITFVVKYRIQEINKQENSTVQQVQAPTPTNEQLEVATNVPIEEKLQRVGGYYKDLDWVADNTLTFKQLDDVTYRDNEGRIYLLNGAITSVKRCKVKTRDGVLCTISHDGDTKQLFVSLVAHYDTSGKHIYKENILMLDHDEYDPAIIDIETEDAKKKAEEDKLTEELNKNEQGNSPLGSEGWTEEERVEMALPCTWCYYDSVLWCDDEYSGEVILSYEDMKKMNIETAEWIRSWVEQ